VATGTAWIWRDFRLSREEREREGAGKNDAPPGGVESVDRGVQMQRLDPRHTARRLARSPAFTLTAVLCLGLGIGVTSSLFTIFNTLLWKPLPVDDPKQRRPNIGLAKKTLSWEPKVSLDDGLAKTIEYFKEKLRKDGDSK